MFNDKDMRIMEFKFRLFLIAAGTVLSSVPAAGWAQDTCRPESGGKEIYLPKALAHMDLQGDTSLYSFQRLRCSRDLALFWERPFGSDPASAPDYEGQNMKVDVDQMLKRTQYFYDFYVDSLKWLLPGSKAERFRMVLMLRYNDDGTAYGGDHDGEIGGLWVSPSRLQDTTLNVLAHELGHSFQAQLGADGDLGLNQGPLWEMTSQWMLWQVNPDWVRDENYHWVEFMKHTNLAFCHFENVYRSPYVLEFFSMKHGREYIGKLWREAREGEDIAQAYMRMSGLSQEQFNAEVYEAAARFMTYDLPRVKEHMRPYANRHSCRMVSLPGDGGAAAYAMAPERTLGSYGYNGIRLEVPDPGSRIRLTLEPDSLAGGATGGFCYGLVAVDRTGNPLYVPMRYVPASGGEAGAGALDYEVPSSGLDYLWLVVTAAPSAHTLSPEAQWYCHFTMEGTRPHEDMLNAEPFEAPARRMRRPRN